MCLGGATLAVLVPSCTHSHPYLLRSVVLGDEPFQFGGSRQLHALKLLQQAHGDGFCRVRIAEGVGSAQQKELMPGISELCPLHIPPSSDPILNSS